MFRSGGRRSRSRSPARRGGARWVLKSEHHSIDIVQRKIPFSFQAEVKVACPQKAPLKLLIRLRLLTIEQQQTIFVFYFGPNIRCFKCSMMFS